jgi:hypothetical protein
MINRVDGAFRAIRAESPRAGGAAATGEQSFADALRRVGVQRDGSGGGRATGEPAAATTDRLRIGERDLASPPASETGVERVPLGGMARTGRRPIGGDTPSGEPSTSPEPADIPRGSSSDDEEPVQLTSRGGYKNAADYTRDEGWAKHPNALYPDPSKPGYWIDPVTGRSGNFPSGYVPGMSLGNPGAPSAGNEPPVQPQDDALSVEMARLGMDPTERLDRMKFVASVDADMRDWLNQILASRGMETVEERSLDTLSDDMATDLQNLRDKRAQKAEVLADLAAGNGYVHGSPNEGGVPVFEPDDSDSDMTEGNGYIRNDHV